jgi:hypothetical protein
MDGDGGEFELERESEWDDREFVSDISGDEDEGLSDLEDTPVGLSAALKKCIFDLSRPGWFCRGRFRRR